MAAPTKYEFSKLGLRGEQTIKHGSKDKKTGEPFDQPALVARIKRASRNWKRRAAKNAETAKARKEIDAITFDVTAPSKARVVITRTA